MAPKIADAFGATFWVAVGMLAAAFVPALLLPRHRPPEVEMDPPAEPAMTAV